MIILIAGASHTGKTALALKLARRCGYACLSLDHLKMGLIRSGQTDLTVYDDEALTPYLWSIASEMVKTAIENEQGLVIEGCYIPFDWRDSFTADYLAHIEYLCLAFSEAYIETRFDNVARFANVVEKRLCADNPDKREFLQENALNVAECRRRGLRCVLVEDEYRVGEMRLEPYCRNDVGALVRLFRETVHTVNATDYTAEQLDAWAPPRIDGAAWHERFAKSHTLVAKECGIAVGFGNVTRAGEVDMLYVHKDCQGQGIATRILEALERHAAEAGAPRLTAHASLTSRPFFERRGYSVVSENEVARNGVILVNFTMEKPASAARGGAEGA